jgi:hypothetical protein
MRTSVGSFLSRRWTAGALLAACLWVPLAGRSAAAIDIATARALPLGTVVTVAGTVTVPSGDDGSGPIRIFVCTSAGIRLGILAPGQHVSVTGLGYQFIDYEVDPRFQGDIHRRAN